MGDFNSCFVRNKGVNTCNYCNKSISIYYPSFYIEGYVYCNNVCRFNGDVLYLESKPTIPYREHTLSVLCVKFEGHYEIICKGGCTCCGQNIKQLFPSLFNRNVIYCSIACRFNGDWHIYNKT